ncbi:MAG: 30S ribosomal protein S17 [Helicobacteraceae bacterium]
MENSTKKRIIQGDVISKSGDKTVSVLVERKVLHPKYKKYIRKFKKYLVHDEKNELLQGDKVVAKECKPFSRKKSFILESFTRPESVE